MGSYLALTDELNDYVHAISVPEDALLARLRVETAALERGHMQIPADQGAFMALLLKLMGARRVLEIGVFTGYSALVMARALPDDGELVGLDFSTDYTAIARQYWQEAGVAHKIDLRLGQALAGLEQLAREPDQWFDFVFIDADKENLDAYYELSLELLRGGGLIAIDNALRTGKVLEPHTDENARYLHDLNLKARDDDRVDVTLVTIGDGLLLARKR